MKGAASSPIGGTDGRLSYAQRQQSEQRRLERKRKNAALDGPSPYKASRRPKNTSELARQCLEQMNRMMRGMEELNRRVHAVSERLNGLAPKVEQMYTQFLEDNGSATPVMTPPPTLLDEDLFSPVRSLFSGLLYPEKECRLLASDAVFTAKLKAEEARIREQAESQEANSAFKPVDLTGSAIQARCLGDCAYATLQSPHHVNQDRFTSFSFQIAYDGKPCWAHFYAVLDGHGPPKEEGYASNFCAENFPQTLLDCMKALNTEGSDYTVANALKMAFVLLDSKFKAYMEERHPGKNLPGTTACLAMIVEGVLFVANCGDSRAVLATDGEEAPLQLSYDFKASDRYAQCTTLKRKGQIVKRKGAHRVDGFLAVTRAIGDEFLRNRDTLVKTISPRPKIYKVALRDVVKPSDSGLLILASDGLFDVASSMQAGEAAAHLSRKDNPPGKIAETLVSMAHHAGSQDDITVGIVPLDKHL